MIKSDSATPSVAHALCAPTIARNADECATVAGMMWNCTMRATTFEGTSIAVSAISSTNRSSRQHRSRTASISAGNSTSPSYVRW
jgi:hypothetical protein